jgi:LPS-assembly lipoprotein
MWWRNLRQWRALAWPARLAVVLAAAGLTAGCWQPLYGARPGPGGEGVQDKFAAVDIPPINAPKGTPAERVAIGMRNALTFDLHNGGSPMPPAYALKVNVGTSQFTAYVDPTTGRPDTQIQNLIAIYQLVELATGKMVINDMAVAHVDYDIPGSQQRFAGQRARRDAEDRAVQVAADMIRNRLASYFVAGT